MKAKLKCSGFAAILLVAFVFIPLLSAQEDDARAQLPKPVFTKAEFYYARTNPSYFLINPASVRLTRHAVKEERDMSYVRMEEKKKTGEGQRVSIDHIINIATKIWKIVSNNAPETNIDTKYAVAYPQGVTAATQLTHWAAPKSYVYGFYAENLLGMRIVDVEYKVIYTYGGAYKGAGKYLTAVTVTPTKVNVGWGYNFSMNASVPDSAITNVGDSKKPVAAMQLKLFWKIATVLKESDSASVYYIQGDGYFQEIANPFGKVLKAEEINSAKPLFGEKIFE